jgi:RNA-binding protein
MADGLTGGGRAEDNGARVLSLTYRERTRLKARAHALEPVVQVGQAGLTASVVAEIDRALAAHERIKVRIGVVDRAERADLCEAICARTGAAHVLRVGKVLGLWRSRPDAGDEEPK